MALIQCQECGKEVSTDAKNCPSCGAKVVPPKKKAGSKKMYLFAFIGVAIIGAVIQTQVDKGKPPPPPPKQLTPEEQAIAKKNSELTVLAKKCTEAISASLKFPEDAKIPSPYSAFDHDKIYKEEKNGIYTVQVTFEARNAFNAMKRSVVECKWKNVGGDFNPIGVKTIE